VREQPTIDPETTSPQISAVRTHREKLRDIRPFRVKTLAVRMAMQWLLWNSMGGVVP
jgi:hypothetical protein